MIQLTFDSQGNFTGKLKTRADVRVDRAGRTLTMAIKVDVLDPQGNVIFSTSGTAEGSRIELEPTS